MYETPLRLLTYRSVMSIFVFLAIAELIVDKLPNTPPRTAAMGLGARVVMGALAGGAIALGSTAGVSGLVGAVLGVIGAIGAAYAGYSIRRGLVAQTHLPDYVVAVVEDLLAISGGLYLVSRL